MVYSKVNDDNNDNDNDNNDNGNDNNDNGNGNDTNNDNDRNYQYLSILFTTTIACNPFSKAFLKTNFVCGFGPSTESITSSTPSTIFIIRSTSPPKSAWPDYKYMVDTCMYKYIYECLYDEYMYVCLCMSVRMCIYIWVYVWA